MPWSLPASVPVGGVAGKLAGDFAKWMLSDSHWLVQNIASAAAESATSYVASTVVNGVVGDVVSAATVTPAQALLQGAVRAVTGESVTDSLIHPETFQRMFEGG